MPLDNFSKQCVNFFCARPDEVSRPTNVARRILMVTLLCDVLLYLPCLRNEDFNWLNLPQKCDDDGDDYAIIPLNCTPKDWHAYVSYAACLLGISGAASVGGYLLTALWLRRNDHTSDPKIDIIMPLI